MRIRVVLYQKSLGIDISDNDIIEMKYFNPHFVCFPEYFFVDRQIGNLAQTEMNQKYQMKRIEGLSKYLNTVIIGGSMPELCGNHLHNTSFVYNNGKYIGKYSKRRLFMNENAIIKPGEAYKIFNAYGIIFGILICADVFDDEGFYFMRRNSANLIFSPTFSIKKTEAIEEKFQRDYDIYVRGARISNSIIIKVCGVKSEYKNFLQARSLIAGPSGIIYRVNPKEEDLQMIIMQELEI